MLAESAWIDQGGQRPESVASRSADQADRRAAQGHGGILGRPSLERNARKSGGEERLLARWANAVHDFVHGGPGNRMTCVHHVFEVFDDSPHDEAKGRRIA